MPVAGHHCIGEARLANDVLGVLMTKVYGILWRTSTHGHRRSARVAAVCIAALDFCWGGGGLWAQTSNTPAAQTPLGSPTPSAAPLAGPQILSVSAYATYNSSSAPETGSGTLQVNSANLPADVGGGGSIVFGWSKFTERTTFSMSYMPSYSAQTQYTSLNALNHAFSLNIARKVALRWTLGFSVAANYSTLTESLFTPTELSNVAAVPSNFSQLSGALLSGNFTGNQQLGVALTNSPLVESPIANLLYGQGVLTSSAQSTLSHSISPRLSVTFTGGVGYTRYISQNQATTPGTPPVLSNTTSGTVGATLSYSLSPVMQLGGTVTTNRISSSLMDAYTTISMATFGRTLGQQWVLQLHGGVGFTNPVGQNYYATQTKPLPAAGGSLAFKTTSHTLLGSIDRSVSDSYGLGSSSSSTATVAWRWRRYGSLWSLQSGLSWQQLQGNAVVNTAGWRATAGLNREFGPHLAMLWQYTYLKYSGGLQASVYSFSESAVRVSMIWTPQPNIPR